MQNNTPTINSDYSEFITDRFNNKAPAVFINEMFALVMNSPETIDEIKSEFKQFADCYPSIEDAKRMIISSSISHRLFYDVFDLEKHWNAELLAPGCFINEEYHDYADEIDKVVDEIKSFIFA